MLNRNLCKGFTFLTYITINMSEEITNLVGKFLSNTLSEEEIGKLLRAYQQKQISEKQFGDYYASKWEDAGQHPSRLAAENREKAWEQFKMYMRRNIQTLPKHKSRWIAMASIAAVAILFYTGPLAPTDP